MRIRLASLLVLALAAPHSARAAPPIPGITYSALSETRDKNPWALAAGAGGAVWYTDSTNRQVGIIAADGNVTKIPLISPVDPANLMRPLQIVMLPNGTAAATVYETNGSGSPLDRTYLALFTPGGSASYTLFPPGSQAACRGLFGSPDCGITVDDNDVIHIAATRINKVLSFSRTGAFLREHLIPGAGTIVDIAPGPDRDTVVVTDVLRPNLWRVNTASGAVSAIALPQPRGEPSDISRAPDGKLYVTDASMNRLHIVRGANEVDAISLPPEGARPHSVAIGSDGRVYITSFGAGHLLQIDPQTRDVAVAQVPNGERPSELVSIACPPDKTENVCLAFNSLPPNVFDFNVRRAEIPRPAQVPKPLLTVEKQVDPELYPRGTSPRYGEYVSFILTIRNVGEGPTVGPWKVTDIPLWPGAGCWESPRYPAEGFNHTFEGPDDRLTFHPAPGSPNAILTTGQTVAIRIYCYINNNHGRLQNRAEVSGGGSITTSDVVTFDVLAPREASRVQTSSPAQAPKRR